MKNWHLKIGIGFCLSLRLLTRRKGKGKMKINRKSITRSHQLSSLGRRISWWNQESISWLRSRKTLNKKRMINKTGSINRKLKKTKGKMIWLEWLFKMKSKIVKRKSRKKWISWSSSSWKNLHYKNKICSDFIFSC